MNLILKWSLIVLGFGIGIFLFNRLGLWMESRGWIYWTKKNSKSASGNALAALDDVLGGRRPEIREMRMKETKNQDGASDDH